MACRELECGIGVGTTCAFINVEIGQLCEKNCPKGKKIKSKKGTNRTSSLLENPIRTYFGIFPGPLPHIFRVNRIY